ncbi:hypothetical protein ACFYO9_37380 [Streptomyces sp. NPDC005863]|uniref:hypothetical protein n=1 Tax=Streptomyces sp. NPDC005863 TaxID=3364735 RepID=UPI00369CCE71
MLGTTFQVTADELKEIFNVRLAPYLPAHLTKAEPNPSGWGNTYTFKPFTGREPKPETPRRYYDDPKLCFRHQDREAGRPEADEAEYDLREKACHFLDQVYDQARSEWRNARYIADLKTVVSNTGDLFKQHGQAKTAVDAAFTYLRDPKAATEWPAAVSRLIDTHSTLMAAAIAFDERARQIAEVHEQHLYEEAPGYDEALKAAGYPQARDWPIASVHDYGRNYHGEYDRYTLSGQAQALIKEQEEHVAKVGRLTGTPTA